MAREVKFVVADFDAITHHDFIGQVGTDFQPFSMVVPLFSNEFHVSSGF